jgi:Glycosyltransferase family 87
MELTPKIRPERYLQVVVLGLISLSFLNMLYCTMAYEFGWGPKTFLVGPDDRFADVIKLSLSFRSVTGGVDKTASFQSWRPIYQDYYEHPDYGGTESFATGRLTHFHHPPLSTLMFLVTGLFIVWTGSPPLTLFLFFFIYLLEVWGIVWIAIPRAQRSAALTLSIWFLCLASYPALVMFGRANYINAGLTTVPIVAFLVAVFARKQASLACLTALAIAVNIHPNAIIFLLALPLVFGLRKAVMPVLQFLAIASAIFGFSYFAAHRLYPDYTIANFRKGVATYGKVYIEDGGGLRVGSSLYGLIRALNRGLHLGVSFPVEMRIFYVLTMLLVVLACVAFWRAWNRDEKCSRPAVAEKQKDMPRRGGQVQQSNPWPLPLVPFFLVSFYCILSPIFADYHLLIFLAPLLLAYFERGCPEQRWRLLTVVALASLLMLSPKNYPLQHASVQVILNPLILCGAALWLALALWSEARQQTYATVELRPVEGR